MSAAARKSSYQLPRGRAMTLFGAFLLFSTLIGYRVVAVQVVSSDEFGRQALDERLRVDTVAARRGEISDANGLRLATNVPASRVSAIVDRVVDKRRAAELLAPLIGRPAAEIEDALLQPELEWVTLARHLDREHAEQVAALKLDGIVLDPEQSRIYPFETL